MDEFGNPTIKPVTKPAFEIVAKRGVNHLIFNHKDFAEEYLNELFLLLADQKNNITCLNLSSKNMSAETAIHIFEFLYTNDCSSLEYINLRNNKSIGYEGVIGILETLGESKYISNLKNINMGECGIPENQVNEFYNLGKSLGIQLNLRKNGQQWSPNVKL